MTCLSKLHKGTFKRTPFSRLVARCRCRELSVCSEGKCMVQWPGMSSAKLVHGPGQQNFQFLTTLGDKGYRIFLETSFTPLYLYV